MQTVTHDKPKGVFHPAKAYNGGWQLGWTVPNVQGFEPQGHMYGTYDEVLAACKKMALESGVSAEAYEATVASAMFPASFEHVLAHSLKGA
jgi:hypothetical protein